MSASSTSSSVSLLTRTFSTLLPAASRRLLLPREFSSSRSLLFSSSSSAVVGSSTALRGWASIPSEKSRERGRPLSPPVRASPSLLLKLVYPGLRGMGLFWTAGVSGLTTETLLWEPEEYWAWDGTRGLMAPLGGARGEP